MVNHWIWKHSGKPFNPNVYDKFGFVYIITNTKNGKAYIGCKQYFIGKSKRKSRWSSYTGSSKHLKEDIQKIGKEHFIFEIIDEFKNKRSLKYYELYYHVKYNVLTAVLEGTNEPAFYNGFVGGKFYRPIQEYIERKFKEKLNGESKEKHIRSSQSSLHSRT